LEPCGTPGPETTTIEPLDRVSGVEDKTGAEELSEIGVFGFRNEALGKPVQLGKKDTVKNKATKLVAIRILGPAANHNLNASG
jgi:hypothetical protein